MTSHVVVTTPEESNPAIDIYRQLRGSYQLSRWGAAWRTILLSIFIVIITAIFLQILLLLGAF